MGSLLDLDYDQSSTPPKLSFYPIFSSKQNGHQPELLTPPHQTLASVPFEWEEAPGKPRASFHGSETAQHQSKTIRSLELPPRLLNEAKIINMPSPTTVLDGPYRVRAPCHAKSLSFGKGSFSSHEDGELEEKSVGEVHIVKKRSSFGSWRRGSFKDEEEVDRDSLDFLSSEGDLKTKVKVTRVRRRRSFLGFSHGTNTSNLLAGIYEGFKQVVPIPWIRRRRENLRKK